MRIKSPSQASIDALSSRVSTVESGFTNHASTDRFRWQDEYDEQRESIIRDAGSSGLKVSADPVVVDGSTLNDIESVNTQQYGGILGVTMVNVDDNFSTVTIDGELKYSSDGLYKGVEVTKYFWIKDGTKYLITGSKSISVQGFEPDPDNPVIVSINKNTQKIADTQLQVAQLEDRLNGKELDPDRKIDIEASSQGEGYTVLSNNNLGAQLTGAGVNALLVNTGDVSINRGGTIIEAYNNLSALGLELGTDPMQPYPVQDGDIITSSGMDNLWIQYYMPGSGS